jgi:hypothetical protein
MRPLFTIGVWLVAACHLAFLLYLVGGGFAALALRRAHRPAWSRRALALHVAAVGWAVGSVTLNLWCPLTTAERWLREGAGMAPLGPEGFIDHYLTGVVYPVGAAGYAQAGVFVTVAISWSAFAVTAMRSQAESPLKHVS